MPVNSILHASLVTAMAHGDERAAAQLYDAYSSIMFSLAIRIVGERADAEEVVLEAFTQAWKGAALYQSARSSVMSWLTMMTRTRALDHVRARMRRVRAVSEAAIGLGDEPLAVAGNIQMASDTLEVSERAVALKCALSTLAKPQRDAIELAFFNGLSHPEIAQLLNEPLGTIKTRIRLGMQHMRHMLGHVAAVASSSHHSGAIELAR
jgi:RNA polymerase sigma-70 factor (ECF subfamily)